MLAFDRTSAHAILPNRPTVAELGAMPLPATTTGIGMKLDLKKLRARSKAGVIAKRRREAAERREEAARQRKLDAEALAQVTPQLARIKQAMLDLADQGERGIQLYKMRESLIRSSWVGTDHRELDGTARGLAVWAKKQGLKVEIIFENVSPRSTWLSVNAYW